MTCGTAFIAAAVTTTPAVRIPRTALVPSNRTACVLSVLSSSRTRGLFPPGVLDCEKYVSGGRFVSISSQIESPQLNPMTQL